MDPRLAASLSLQAQGLLADLAPLLEAWARSGSCTRGGIDALFRALHTIKGGCAFVGLHSAGTLAHEAEKLLDALRRHDLEPTAEVVTALRGALTSIDGLLREPQADEDALISEERDALRACLGLEPMATEDDRPFSPPCWPLVPAASHLALAARERLTLLRVTIRPIQDLEAQGRDALAMSELLALVGDPAEIAFNLAAIGGLDDCLDAELRYQVLLLSEVDAAEAADILALPKAQIETLEPASVAEASPCPDGLRALVQALATAAQELADRASKEVSLHLQVEDLALSIPSRLVLQGALVHLLRNAIAHGIESPQQRAAVGKPPRGSILVEALCRDGSLRLAVSDDGAGIHPALVAERAAARGLIPDSASYVRDPARSLALLLEPGMSTKTIPDEMAGQGVGLDSVRRAAVQLAGRVSIASDPGHGTTVILELPLARVSDPHSSN